MPSRRPWQSTRLKLLAPGLVILVAAAVRFVGLEHPGELVLDEPFYAQEACEKYGADKEACGSTNFLGAGDPRFAQVAREIFGAAPEDFFGAHPPLGSRAVAWSTHLGFEGVAAWRVTAALAGTLTVALTFAVGRRILGSSGWAAFAAGLVGIDQLHVVMSRVAMLDMFLGALTMTTLLTILWHRRLMTERSAERKPQRLTVLPVVLAMGASSGLAVATKWSALPLVLLVALAAGARGASPAGGRRARGVAAAVLVVGAATLAYIASYVGTPSDGEPWHQRVWSHQVEMARFHAAVEFPHPAQSPAWSWLLLKRPYVIQLEPNDGSHRAILAMPNPALAWIGIVAVIAVAGVAWRRRTRAAVDIAVSLSATFGAWMLLDIVRPERGKFIFYITPAIPLVALAVAWLCRAIADRWRSGRWIVAGYASLVVTAALAFAPTTFGWKMETSQRDLRTWFQSCERGPLRAISLSASQPHTPGAEATTTRVRLPLDDLTPPTGWCWR